MSTTEIIQNIDKAIASHGMWKMRLKNAIQTQTSEFDVAFVRVPNNCEFGKWLDKDRMVLSRYPVFNQIVQLHKDLHIETAVIMQMALARKAAEATARIAVGSNFASISSKLTIAMMGWKRELKEVA
ncbi:MAG: CZB domain-containing protein [Cyclobacteriaceae bacterium]|nr:CZB domain-containing protein [Cyclobacteriaceae bacterium]